MHLAFVDIVYGYNAARPEEDAPLGGTTSAVCFLAREMVKAGIACTFFNTIHEPQTAHGIQSLPLDRLITELGDHSYDAVIFCGRWLEDMVQLVRKATQAPLVAWMHESAFHSKVVPAVDVFDAITFVSEWQQRVNQPHVKPHWKQAVLRNAMNPQAAHMFKSENIRTSKQTPPVLLYAGSAARGVFHLPPILDLIRKKCEDFSVEIFCNTNPSGDAAQDKKYIDWLRSLPNVTHVGMAGQSELIRHMKAATIMAAPNPWPETSCIAMIEGMAAGLAVVATNRAALPETASGFAQLVPVEDADHPTRFNMAVPHEAFAAAILNILEERAGQPERLEAKLRKQVDFFNTHYQWDNRIGPWMEFIGSLQKP